MKAKNKGILSFRLSFIIAAFTSFVLFSHTALGVTQSWQKNAFITNSFFEIALGSEYGGVALTIRKWVKPIRIYVEHQVGDVALHDSLLNAQIADLRQITGVDIKRVRSPNQANIKYYFTSQKKLPQLVKKVSGSASLKHLKTAVCMATMRANANGSTHSAAIYIPVNQARMHAKLPACIVEELTQVLGLPRDSDAVYPSIFNDHTPNQTLTGLDVVLLKILYSSQVQVGMNRAQLRPVLKRVLKTLRKTGQISGALKASRSLSFCQFMDC